MHCKSRKHFRKSRSKKRGGAKRLSDRTATSKYKIKQHNKSKKLVTTLQNKLIKAEEKYRKIDEMNDKKRIKAEAVVEKAVAKLEEFKNPDNSKLQNEQSKIDALKQQLEQAKLEEEKYRINITYSDIERAQ